MVFTLFAPPENYANPPFWGNCAYARVVFRRACPEGAHPMSRAWSAAATARARMGMGDARKGASIQERRRPVTSPGRRRAARTPARPRRCAGPVRAPADRCPSPRPAACGRVCAPGGRRCNCAAPADGWRQFEMRRESSNGARGHFTGTPTRPPARPSRYCDAGDRFRMPGGRGLGLP